METTTIEKAYRQAVDRYADLGVQPDLALDVLSRIAISMHCWQGDDVRGFEGQGGLSDGGIMATGAYPGRARTADELRGDLHEAFRLIPGRQRLNLHAMYLEADGPLPDRDRIEPGHFQRWIDWAKELGIGIDFNPTFFSHPKAADGFTLTSRDEGVRRFWVEHGVACRNVGEAIGRQLGSPCVTNVWIPDGYKDVTIDRRGPRELLARSLDEIFAEPIDPAFNLDAVESKLFGIGSETYVAGSHEFYLGYAIRNGKLLCLDAGHFHPTETIADKISSVLLFLDEILLEIVRGEFLERVHIGLDFFDASIHRVAAWVIGARAMGKALLAALLEPTATLRRLEAEGDFTARLAMVEEIKTLPFGAVWDYYCLRQGVPVGMAWMEEVRRYQRQVTGKR